MNLRRSLAVVLAGVVGLSMLGGAPATAHPGPHGEAHVLIFTKTTQFRHTEAIEQGVPVLTSAFAAAGITSEHTEDSTVFNDEALSHFDALVMFQTSGDPWSAAEKAALERYTQAGGGIVAIHNATDMRGNYTWWDNMIGSLMPGHAATGTSPGLPGTVRVEDRTHPSTQHLPLRWNRADEWYNFSTNVRGTAHVLATMDETTYDPGGNRMGYDHPISWCKPYDGGRAWMTAMGHFGAHYQEQGLVEHILGGVKWAAGMVAGDCGGTKWDQFERVPLDQNTSAPYAIDVAPDGRVFFTELVRGQIRVYDPQARTTSTAITIPVYSGGEDGLLGITLDPNFAQNGWLYVYYSPASTDDTNPANFVNRLSRLTVGEGSQIDRASEKVLLEVPARRLPDEPGHTGGGLDFGPDGSLYLGVGDDVNPHSEPSGGYAPLSERDGTFHDARATSANTNDLRGKVLRITPQADGTYTVPAGNMFPPGTDKTRPEIYAMGFRNPFRFAIDPQTGALGVADYAPDNSAENPNRGPAGIVEWNLIKEPGFYGWPLCMGNNEPFRDVDYRTNPVTVGPYFDCANPINDSIRNTGLTQLPPAKPAQMWYGYQRSSVPSVIPQGGGLAPMGGPFYDYDPNLQSDTKFPSSYDGKAFFYEWARNKMYSIIPTENGTAVEKVNPFLPQTQFLAPIDSKFGSDGSMYVLDWGGGFGRDNPNSGLYRIDYVSGSRSPTASIQATPDSGHAPLEVGFNGSSSTDPENEALTYEWDFTGDGTADSTDVSPTFTYTANGVYNARLTVTDPHGKTGTTTVPITVGNTRPDVNFQLPPTGSFFNFGDEISWQVDVTDAEDTTIADADIVIQPALGHDEHPHPADPLHGRTGSVVTELGGGHGEDMNVFYVLDARYTDKGGAGGIPALTGSDTTLLFPKQREAEFFKRSNQITVGPSRDIEGHANAITGQNGAWAAYEPVNLRNVNGLIVRASANAAGTVELRRGAPDGPLLGTAQVPATGPTSYVDVPVSVTDPGESFTLYAVFPGAGERRVNFIEADGKGASPTSKPKVAITAPTSQADLEPGQIPVRANASDAENTITQVEFFVDGQSIGADTSAPYEVTWNATEERRYRLTAVATNNLGAKTTSRIVQAEVGDLFGDWQTFANVQATFDRPDTDTWIVNAGGANMWQATDEYGSVYLPGAAGREWTATVKIERQGNSAGSAKAGIIVRNDVTQPGRSPGYAALMMRPSGGFEWLRDGDGNGTLDSSTGASTTSYPAWVRLVRDGDSYTAYWSKDGENFTAVGDPVTLPNAGSAQDVGLAVTAHNAAATSEVEFTGWTLDDEAWTPGPDPEPEPSPTCLMVGTDGFDGSTLNRKRWSTFRNVSGLPMSVSGGRLVMPVTNGDINEASPGPINYVGQTARPGAWTATTTVSIAHTRQWQHAGMLMHGNDNNYVKLAFTRNSSGGRLMEFLTETNGTRAWHANQVLPANFPSTVQLRLVSDGTSLKASYSTDGQAWTVLPGSASVVPNSTIGLMAAGDTAAATVNASFDQFTIVPDSTDTGDRAPSDEFDGTAIDACRWSGVVRYDSAHLSMVEGQLRIKTQDGDINGSDNNGPRNFVLQDLPAGDWSVETRLTPAMLHQWQLAGILVYGNDDNYVKFDVVATNGGGAAKNLAAELVSEKDAQFGNGGNRNIDVAESTESGWYHLRLSKEGNTYTAEISDNGTSWRPLGEPVTNDFPMKSVGLLAIGPEQTSSVTVAFDYFRVGGPPDREAPVVTPTVSQPDGANGWHRTPATVTAAATDNREDGVTIEYRTGSGDWVSYRDPVVLSDDGSHSLEFRAIDAAGNVSDAVPAMALVDRTAPAVTVSGITAGTGYDVGKALELAAAAEDPASGVGSVQVRLDGKAVAVPLSVTPTAGQHELHVVATDEAGNAAEVKVPFAVTVTYETAADLLTRYRMEGRISLASYLQMYVFLSAAKVFTQVHAPQLAAASLDAFASVAARVREPEARAQLQAVATVLKGALTT